LPKVKSFWWINKWRISSNR